MDAVVEGSFALDDERRVKVLSPSALVTKRFFANRLALVGLVAIGIMFVFSFIGGVLMPYGEAQVFMTYEDLVRDYVHAAYTGTVFTTPAPDARLSVPTRGALVSALRAGKQSYTAADGTAYVLTSLGTDAAVVTTASGTPVLLASTRVVSPLVPGFAADFAFVRAFEEAKGASFTVGGGSNAGTYTVRQNAESFYINRDGIDVCVASTLSIQPASPNSIVPETLRTLIADAIATGNGGFNCDGIDYRVSHTGTDGQYAVKTAQSTQLVALYEAPSMRHWLGTDKAGMDVLVRLMYGGRVSLLIGFVVILIESLIGITLGGISGYFGKWVDMLIMRVVDVLNCIPSLPLYLIIGAFMDGNKVDPTARIYVLMLVMGLMSWPGIARVVRAQILSLREQEFMTAAEALGLRVSSRIFRHLIPNVIPQLIVLATMGLGNVILAESVLSFLGLGVKFPFASWGNILYAVNDIHVMTNYWFVWIPAGFCILITVLSFNFIGDGLRDAFDPKMKR